MKIVLNMPREEKDLEALSSRTAQFRGQLLQAYINSLCCTAEEKKELARQIIEKLK